MKAREQREEPSGTLEVLLSTWADTVSGRPCIKLLPEVCK